MSKKHATLYLVERVVWRMAGYERVRSVAPSLSNTIRTDPFVPGVVLVQVWRRDEGGYPVRAFLDRVDAEQFMRKQENADWATINPFYYGDGIAKWTSLDTGRLCDWLLDIGLEPPTAKKLTPKAWRTWYDNVRESLTDLHLSKLREALDGVRLYRLAVLTEDGTRVEEPAGKWV